MFQLLVAAVGPRERLDHDERDGDLVGRPLPGVVVRTAADGALWVAGPGPAWGVLGQQDYGTRDVWIYDVATNTYEKGPSLPEPRGAGAIWAAACRSARPAATCCASSSRARSASSPQAL